MSHTSPNDKVEQLAANRLTMPQDAIASLLQRLVRHPTTTERLCPSKRPVRILPIRLNKHRRIRHRGMRSLHSFLACGDTDLEHHIRSPLPSIAPPPAIEPRGKSTRYVGTWLFTTEAGRFAAARAATRTPEGSYESSEFNALRRALIPSGWESRKRRYLSSNTARSLFGYVPRNSTL